VALEAFCVKEKVPFRLIEMPCCHALICWVNPRIPNFCSECGKHVFLKLKFEGMLPEPLEAWLDIKTKMGV
jgi:hypothetical protein